MKRGPCVTYHRRPSINSQGPHIHTERLKRVLQPASCFWQQARGFSPREMVYLRAGTVVQQPTFLEEVLALPIRIYHMLVFFLMTLIDPKAAKQGPGGSGAARSGPRGGSSGAGQGPGGSKRLGGMDTVKGAGNCPPTGG